MPVVYPHAGGGLGSRREVDRSGPDAGDRDGDVEVEVTGLRAG